MNQLLVWICIRTSGWMRLIIAAINIICFSLKATDGFPLSSLGASFDNIKCLGHQTSRAVGDDGTKSIVLWDHCCLHMWSMSVLFQSWLELVWTNITEVYGPNTHLLLNQPSLLWQLCHSGWEILNIHLSVVSNLCDLSSYLFRSRWCSSSQFFGQHLNTSTSSANGGVYHTWPSHSSVFWPSPVAHFLFNHL